MKLTNYFSMKCSEGFKYSSGQKTRTCDWRGKWAAPQGSGINCEGNQKWSQLKTFLINDRFLRLRDLGLRVSIHLGSRLPMKISNFWIWDQGSSNIFFWLVIVLVKIIFFKIASKVFISPLKQSGSLYRNSPKI